ncbi:hypothetical protein [Thalassotalea agarivorans]|uniref:Uncharacterized protein n=1 Tax=Thalassotalea agarivorans TaxID=349064 RepID=A0A1I0F1Y2_THASX|nr:hypothetical protein [Thalassotalea agarivorans]SET52006.1 hypothetical protein SAMN05660429_02034 [Thalassotalea agarivorans]
MRYLFIVAAVAYFAYAMPVKEDTWTGFIYLERDNPETFVPVGTYDSLENCKTAAKFTLHNMNVDYVGEFECALNCDSTASDPHLSMCESRHSK